MARNRPTSKLAPMAAGQRYGRLIARDFVRRDSRGNQYWSFQCDCGGEIVTQAGNARREHTKSCGCLAHEKRTIHGMYGSPEYWVWRGMLRRCQDRGEPAFGRYGARGIKVCESWQSFASFYADMGPRPSPKHSIDRHPDQNGDYRKDNCRWATQREQMRNCSSNHIVEYRGQRMSLIEACEISGLSERAVRNRIRRGWPVALALSAPIKHGRPAGACGGRAR
jgi:hypothetical protein